VSGGEIVAGGRDLRSSRPEDPGDVAVIEFDAAGAAPDPDSLAAFVKAAVRDEIEAGGSRP